MNLIMIIMGAAPLLAPPRELGTLEFGMFGVCVKCVCVVAVCVSVVVRV